MFNVLFLLVQNGINYSFSIFKQHKYGLKFEKLKYHIEMLLCQT